MRFALFFAAGVAGALAAGWLLFPRALYQAEAQPLQFNHKMHKDKAGTECSGCHELLPDGQFAGIPKLESCAMCHAEPQGSTQTEKQLVENYVKPQREIPWKVYLRQPANVRFSHAVHTRQGGLKCEQCHGGHGDSERIEPFYRNRISGESRNVWGPRMVRAGLRPGEAMKMGDCESCHAGHNVLAGCLGCHQ